MVKIQNIAVLLTCHNRKAKTVRCLSLLYRQQGLDSNFILEVFLVDDASNDGTPGEVRAQYPEVNIISGDGNLFWNRGMYLAWQQAAKTKKFDFYLWLNDDTFLKSNAISELLEIHSINSIVCGSTQSLDCWPTYGGFIEGRKGMIIPNGNIQQCDYVNGNCVLIPNEVFKKVGFLDPVFHHAVGDFDYGLRARSLGIELRVAPHYIGTCEGHTVIPRWRSTSESMFNRLKFLYSASSGCYPTQFFIFERRHYGLKSAIRRFILIHIRAIFPQLWYLAKK